MKKILISTLFILLVNIAFGQAKNVDVKKEKLYINDSAICIIDKKKKGFLSIPSFELRTLDEKPLGFVQYLSISAPVSGTLQWYRFTLEGIADSVLLTNDDFRNFNKATFIKIDEAVGKIIADYNLLNNGKPDAGAFEKFKKDYPTDHSTEYAALVAKETICHKQIREAAPKADAAKPVTVELLSTTAVTKSTTVLEYDIKQDGVSIGKLLAKGDPKNAKKDDAEWDYSPGILDLDGGSPLNYEITNSEGCIVGRYSGSEKILATWKDGISTKMGDIKKYNKDGVKTRLAYVQAIANLLVAKKLL